MACFLRCAHRAVSSYRFFVLGTLALCLFQVGCCSVHISTSGKKCGVGLAQSACGSSDCGSTACGESCQTGIQDRDPLFDGTLRHRVKHKIGSCANSIACAGGCGEVYYDESINDPRRCDPCDQSGNWTGESGHCGPWYTKLGHLWGIPYKGSQGCPGGSCLTGGSCLKGGCGKSLCGKGLCGKSGCTGGCDASSHTQGVVHGGHAHGGGSHCASCQHAADSSYSTHEFHGGNIHSGDILGDESGVIYGDVGQGTSSPSMSQPSPTPATPRSNASPNLQQPSIEQPALPNSVPAAGSSAQQRMKLHQRSDRSDPNGKLSVQLVNGQRRLVVQPQ